MAQISGIHKEKLNISLTTSSETSAPAGTNLLLDSGGVNPIQVTLMCDGGSIEVGLTDNNSGGSGINADGRNNANAVNGNMIFYRDGVAVSQIPWSMVDITGSSRQIEAPLSAFKFVDVPPAGSHTYTVAYQNNNASPANNNQYDNVVLYAIQR